MKAGFRFAISLVAAATLVGVSFASQITGKWTGHIKIDLSKMKAPAGGEGGGGGGGGRRDPAKMAEMMSKMSITLTLNADKTFVRVMKGGRRSDQTQKGTWSQVGNHVTLLVAPPAGPPKNTSAPRGLEPNAGAGSKPKPTVLTLSKDGKSLTGTTMRGAGTITFTH